MTNTTLLALAVGLFVTGCGPSFDPASLIQTTRVVGARVEIEGAPDRAAPKPGETANVTWLVTSPEVPPPLGWTFAVCAPAGSSGGCGSATLATFEGTSSPPRISIPVPAADVLGAATRLIVYGEIGDTAVSLEVPLQRGDEANHNPTAERAFTLDGQPWPALAAGDDPCQVGLAVSAAKDHVIGNLTEGSDRERYNALVGDPPVPTPARERLQISQFTTAGKLKSQFSFVEATDDADTTTVAVTWEAPKAAEVPVEGVAVTFTFVVRDNRGGVDWTNRAVCVNQ